MHYTNGTQKLKAEEIMFRTVEWSWWMVGERALLWNMEIVAKSFAPKLGWNSLNITYNIHKLTLQ